MSAALPQPTGALTRQTHRTVSLRSFESVTIWLLFASSFLVVIEPAPFEIMFFVLLAVFMLTGLTISIMFLPMIALLILYNIGGGLSLIQVADETRAIWFIAISVYMAVMGIVVASIFSQDSPQRLAVMKSGYVFAGCISHHRHHRLLRRGRHR